MNNLVKILVVLFLLNVFFGVFVWAIKQLLFFMLVTTGAYLIYTAIFPKQKAEANAQ